jgi:hypothetical protein
MQKFRRKGEFDADFLGFYAEYKILPLAGLDGTCACLRCACGGAGECCAAMI